MDRSDADIDHVFQSFRAVFGVLFGALTLVHGLGLSSASGAVHQPALGVYAGPDSKGVAGAATFASFSGAPVTNVLDFAATDSWANIDGPNWLIGPHQGGPQLEYSLPMLPDGSQYTLSACAAGSYDSQWRQLASNLIGHQLANTIVRPGWEFNGTWYRWSAKSDIAGYIGCFRHIVTTMRAVPGQHFTFDWTVNIGANAFPAEQAYPGDAYVDDVGVDVYDTSWAHYTNNAPAAAAQAAAWNDDLNGNHGLSFWSSFANAHHKALAIPEWGLTWLSNGHGGGDDPAYVDHMFDFMTNPANNVAFEHYFNVGSSTNDHVLTGTTRFPASAREFQARVQALKG